MAVGSGMRRSSTLADPPLPRPRRRETTMRATRPILLIHPPGAHPAELIAALDAHGCPTLTTTADSPPTEELALAVILAGVSDPAQRCSRLLAAQSDLAVIVLVDEPTDEALAALTAGAAVIAARVTSADLAGRLACLATGGQPPERLTDLLAHDIRLPLFGVVGHLDLILDDVYGPPPEAQREALRTARQAARRALGLLDELLDWTAARRGALTLRLETLVAGEVANAAVEQLAGVARLAGVAIDLRHPTPAVLRADRWRLERILLNLLDNAIRATPEGGRVTLAIDAAETEVGFTVVDEGPGLSETQLAELFEPWRTTRPRGHGLGLASVRELVARHGGRITARSGPDGGLAVEVRLPREPTSA